MNKWPKRFRFEFQQDWNKFSLNNKTWWCPQCEKTSTEILRYFFGIKKGILGCHFNFLWNKSRFWSWNEVAEGKLASKTMLKTLMCVVDFGFVMIVNVVAVFFWKLFFQMAHCVKWLEQYCQQYDQSHDCIYYEEPFFHYCKCKTGKRKTAWF